MIGWGAGEPIVGPRSTLEKPIGKISLYIVCDDAITTGYVSVTVRICERECVCRTLHSFSNNA